MAEVTGLRNNGLPYPVYGAPFGIVAPILDADGDPVTSAAGLDSEISKNGDSLADCTNEATEIGGGLYYLLLTGTEMTADVIAGVIKTSTEGAKTTTFALYPRKLVTIRSGTAAGGDTGYITLDGSASAIDDYYNGMLCVATIDSVVEARVITNYTGSNKQAAVTPAWNTAPDDNDTFIVYLPEGVQIPTVDVTLWKGAAAAAMTGDAYAVVAHADHGNAKLVRSTTPANTLTVDASHRALSDLASILGTALTETSGQIAAAFKKFFDKGTPTGTINSLPDAVAGAAGGVFIAGANAATSVTTALTANITGNLSGSVGSVTGAVGSVTGAVGSVTGAIGSVAANGITATSIAADAINAASVKADAVTKIQNGLATPTNITAGTITTVTNLTNAPTNGDLTATMKSSVTTAATAATPIAAAVTGAVGSVTGAVGSVTGSVGSIAAGGIAATSFAAGAIDAAAIKDAAIDIATFAADVKTGSYINAQVKGQDNIDFGALQKASLNAATPASVTGAVGSVTGSVGSVTGAVGSVTGAVGSVTNGVKLASDGLDAISTTEPSGSASDFREMLVAVWRHFYKKVTLTSSEMKHYDDAGTSAVTTQALSDDGTTQTQGAAS